MTPDEAKLAAETVRQVLTELEEVGDFVSQAHKEDQHGTLSAQLRRMVTRRSRDAGAATRNAAWAAVTDVARVHECEAVVESARRACDTAQGCDFGYQLRTAVREIVDHAVKRHETKAQSPGEAVQSIVDAAHRDFVAAQEVWAAAHTEFMRYLPTDPTRAHLAAEATRQAGERVRRAGTTWEGVRALAGEWNDARAKPAEGA